MACVIQAFQVFFQQHAHEQGIIAWNQNTIVMAFRGTSSMANVRTDAKVRSAGPLMVTTASVN